MNNWNHIYKLSSVLVLILSAYSLPVIAEPESSEKETGFGAIIKISTLGPSVELDYSLNKNWNIRVQANG